MGFGVVIKDLCKRWAYQLFHCRRIVRSTRYLKFFSSPWCQIITPEFCSLKVMNGIYRALKSTDCLALKQTSTLLEINSRFLEAPSTLYFLAKETFKRSFDDFDIAIPRTVPTVPASSICKTRRISLSPNIIQITVHCDQQQVNDGPQQPISQSKLSTYIWRHGCPCHDHGIRRCRGRVVAPR